MKFLRVLLFLAFLACAFQSNSQSVYTTKTGEKYHSTNCRYLKHSKKEMTLQQALDLGYKACSVCKPGSEIELKKESTKENFTTSQTSNTKKATATQCTGKTKSGARCKRMTKNASGRCYQH